MAMYLAHVILSGCNRKQSANSYALHYTSTGFLGPNFENIYLNQVVLSMNDFKLTFKYIQPRQFLSHVEKDCTIHWRVPHNFSHMLYTASHKKQLIRNKRSIILPILNTAEAIVT
jgi:hypothetical protein